MITFWPYCPALVQAIFRKANITNYLKRCLCHTHTLDTVLLRRRTYPKMTYVSVQVAKRKVTSL